MARNLPAYLLLLTLAVLLAAGGSAAADRPNIVLVFIDDMGWGDFSCFGNQDAQTPHVDRLASEGIRFEQFYVNSPICSPSRLSAMALVNIPGRCGDGWRCSRRVGGILP